MYRFLYAQRWLRNSSNRLRSRPAQIPPSPNLRPAQIGGGTAWPHGNYSFVIKETTAKNSQSIVPARNTAMCEKPPERKTHFSKTHSNIPRKRVLDAIHKRFATAHGDVTKCHCHYFPASQTALIKKEGGVKDLFDKCPAIVFSQEHGFLSACQDKATLRIMNGLFATKMKETAEPTMTSTEHEGTQMILRSLHGDLHQYSIFFCRFTSIQDTRCSWYNLCRAGLTLLDVGENAFVKLDY